MLTLVVFPAMCRVTRPAKPSTSITMSGMIVRRRSVVWKLVGKRHSRGMSVKMSSWIRPIHLRSDEKKAGNLICRARVHRGGGERWGVKGGRTEFSDRGGFWVTIADTSGRPRFFLGLSRTLLKRGADTCFCPGGSG